MSAWSHLPNAAHIDRVLTSLKEHSEIWITVLNAVPYAAWDAARDEVWDAARDEVWEEAQSRARTSAWGAAWFATQSVILALVAYDHSAKYLNMTSENLKTWALLSEEPAAVLLLPAVIAFERISELELV